jgi:hypothetical protein
VKWSVCWGGFSQTQWLTRVIVISSSPKVVLPNAFCLVQGYGLMGRNTQFALCFKAPFFLVFSARRQKCYVRIGLLFKDQISSLKVSDININYVPFISDDSAKG